MQIPGLRNTLVKVEVLSEQCLYFCHLCYLSASPKKPIRVALWTLPHWYFHNNKCSSNYDQSSALCSVTFVCSFAELHIAEQLSVHSEGVGRMCASVQGGSNKQKSKKRRKVFNTYKKRNRKRRALTLALHCTHPICFVPSYLPLPSEGEPLGAILGPSLLPWPPFSPQPLKSCTAMCMALMFALYPTCKAIIIHASWQSQALSLLHL